MMAWKKYKFISLSLMTVYRICSKLSEGSSQCGHSRTHENSALLTNLLNGFLDCSDTHHLSTEWYKKCGRNFGFMGQAGNWWLLALFTSHWRELSHRQPVTGNIMWLERCLPSYYFVSTGEGRRDFRKFDRLCHNIIILYLVLNCGGFLF